MPDERSDHANFMSWMYSLRTGATPPQTVLSIAHRGARAFAPENTLPAFQKAIDFGCLMIELDVHLCKDGTVIVHHDDRLTRCTDVSDRFPDRAPYFVSDFTYGELQTLNAGRWFVEQLARPARERQDYLQSATDDELNRFVCADDLRLYESGTVVLPTLEQALELGKRTGVTLNIELKTLPRMYPGLAEAVVRLVSSLEMTERVLVSSFDHEQLVAVRQRSKTIATGVLSSDRLANVPRYLELLDADAYHPGCDAQQDSIGFGSVRGQLDFAAIADVRSSGRHLIVWTCNDRDRMRQLITAGVSGIISDYPNRLQEVITEVGGDLRTPVPNTSSGFGHRSG